MSILIGTDLVPSSSNSELFAKGVLKTLEKNSRFTNIMLDKSLFTCSGCFHKPILRILNKVCLAVD